MYADMNGLYLKVVRQQLSSDFSLQIEKISA